MPPNARPSSSGWRVLGRISVLLLLILAAHFATDWIVGVLKLELRPSTEDTVHQFIMVTAVVYTVLIAIPFVPGIEIALALIGMIGPGIVPLLYLGTIVGLSLSFFVGRFLSLSGLIGLLEGLRLVRTGRLLRTIEPMNGEERLRFLISKAPYRFVPLLLRHRYLALAISLNLPGNILLGGGGGLALVAGVSRLYPVPAFLAVIALAVSPVPLTILIFGHEFLSG